MDSLLPPLGLVLTLLASAAVSFFAPRQPHAKLAVAAGLELAWGELISFDLDWSYWVEVVVVTRR